MGPERRDTPERGGRESTLLSWAFNTASGTRAGEQVTPQSQEYATVDC